MTQTPRRWKYPLLAVRTVHLADQHVDVPCVLTVVALVLAFVCWMITGAHRYIIDTFYVMRLTASTRGADCATPDLGEIAGITGVSQLEASRGPVVDRNSVGVGFGVCQ